MTAENDKFVEINYTLKDADGNIVDTSADSAPLGFVMGKGYLLPKFEQAIQGKNPCDKFDLVLEAKDGYGEYDENLVTKVDRKNFELDSEIEVGMMFQAMTPMGPQIVRVTKVEDDGITVDMNHELAGKTLYFDVEVLSVRDATEQELSGGCGGGCGGCGGNCDGGCGDGECGGDCSCDGGCGGCGR